MLQYLVKGSVSDLSLTSDVPLEPTTCSPEWLLFDTTEHISALVLSLCTFSAARVYISLERMRRNRCRVLR